MDENSAATEPPASSLQVSSEREMGYHDHVVKRNIQVQVRTKTPTGIQIETMDLDKLFEIAQ